MKKCRYCGNDCAGDYCDNACMWKDTSGKCYHGYDANVCCHCKEVKPLRAVIRELMEAGNVAIKGDYSDWDTVLPKALALLGSEQGTNQGEE